MTFDAGGVAQMNGDGWEFDGIIGAYDPKTGKAANYQKLGWQQETYTWNEITKLIEQRKFIDFEWDYTFYTGTKLIESITDLDGQVVNFYYDSMMRIQRISARSGAVETEFSYVYGGAGQTYVERKTTYAADPTGNSELLEVRSRQYFDGLGKAILEVQIGHSENGKDVVSAIEYDNNGRPYKQYEAVESPHSDGRFYQPPTSTPHTLTEYEASSLNRVKQVMAPDWHATQAEYGANTTADAVKNQDTGGNYPAGTLFKNTTIDGNGNKKIVFADFRGKVILERTESADGTSQNDLYRNYDLKEREKSVYPPDADATTPNLIYTKLYDAEDNIIEQKIPDAEKIEMVYDIRNLLIAKRGGNLRAAGKWRVLENDFYGRVTKTGLNILPTLVNEIWTETFWDGNSTASLEQILGIAASNSLANPRIKIGKVTATKTKVLDGNTATPSEVLRVMNYNDYGQLIWDLGNNHRSGRLWKYFEYDLADNLVRQKRIFHTVDIFAEKRDTINTTFDNQGRVKDNFHALQNEQRQQINRLEYTAKDELKTKFLGGTGSGFLQQIDYAYLNNGFLSGINPTMSGDDLFQLNINYDQTIAGLSGIGQKNGNITSLSWQVKGGTLQQYGFEYDYIDRLTAANYNSPNNDYGTSYGYDARGNILNLSRRGMYSDGTTYTSQQIDNMAFTPHAGTNKIKTITDAAPCPDNEVIHQALDNTEMHAVGQTIKADNLVNENASITYQAGTSITLKAGFHAKSGTDFVAKIGTCPGSGFETGGFVQRSTNEYLYDTNGNQTRDPNKGITILYNYFNLPYQITFDNGNVIEWLYDTGGTKLQKKTTSNGVVGLTLDYLGGNFEYLNDTLDAIYLEDAKLTFDKGTPNEYQYYLRDYNQNNRVLFKDDGNGHAQIVQENHFYPYGLSFQGDFIQNTGKKDRYHFNSFERTADFGLGLDVARYRTYNPAIGRWLQIDPQQELFTSWTPYKFGMNNPILFNDPNGDCEICKEAIINSVVFVAGAANAVASNLTGNFPGTRGNPSDFGKYSRAAAIGQQTGDVLSLAAGTAGTILGAVAATGSGLTTPVTGPVGAGGAVALGTVATASAGVAATALSNLTEGNGIVQANDNQGSGEGRGKNKRKPDSEATGDHSVTNDRGNSTYKQNDKNPTGFDEVKRTDVQGKAHTNRDGTKVETPHTHTKGSKDARSAVKEKDY